MLWFHRADRAARTVAATATTAVRVTVVMALATIAAIAKAPVTTVLGGKSCVDEGDAAQYPQRDDQVEPLQPPAVSHLGRLPVAAGRRAPLQNHSPTWLTKGWARSVVGGSLRPPSFLRTVLTPTG